MLRVSPHPLMSVCCYEAMLLGVSLELRLLGTNVHTYDSPVLTHNGMIDECTEKLIKSDQQILTMPQAENLVLIL